MKKLNLQTGYIADAILITKKNRFNEEFTTIEEVNIIKEIIEKRIQQKELNVKFVYSFFNRYFNIINGLIITKADNETESLKKYISGSTIEETIAIQETIYDENLIYLCLCEIMINKLNNSIDHTCSNCNTECCGGRKPETAKNCERWTHDFEYQTNKNLRRILGKNN